MIPRSQPDSSEWMPCVILKRKDGAYAMRNSIQDVDESEYHEYTGGYCEAEFIIQNGKPIVRMKDGTCYSIE